MTKRSKITENQILPKVKISPFASRLVQKYTRLDMSISSFCVFSRQKRNEMFYARLRLDESPTVSPPSVSRPRFADPINSLNPKGSTSFSN
jgi:hypothetical protein